jgi:tetrahydromethanopterin S-methyltransferase subunit B
MIFRSFSYTLALFVLASVFASQAKPDYSCPYIKNLEERIHKLEQSVSELQQAMSDNKKETRSSDTSRREETEACRETSHCTESECTHCPVH